MQPETNRAPVPHLRVEVTPDLGPAFRPVVPDGMTHPARGVSRAWGSWSQDRHADATEILPDRGGQRPSGRRRITSPANGVHSPVSTPAARRARVVHWLQVWIGEYAPAAA